MTRSVLFLVAAWFGGTGLWLLASPAGFHASVPGVAETGPLNTHFFRDAGLAFVVSALALALGAWLRDRWVALVGVGFPLLHGGLHLVESLHHGPHGGPGEIVATVLPALIALAAALRLHGTTAGDKA